VLSSIASNDALPEAAAEAGVPLPVVVGWLEHDPLFKSACEQCRRAHAEQVALDFLELRNRAVMAIEELLDGPTTPPEVKLKAALAVIELSRDAPNRIALWQGWDPRGATVRTITLKGSPG
jgi:hypothetical protein